MTARLRAFVAARAFVIAMACSLGVGAASAANLEKLDPLALQGIVEATAKEMLLPGVMVLLRTPQGSFVSGHGATELGGTTPPRADTYFRIASNTKTMTAAVIVQLAQEGKLGFDDRVSKYLEGIPNGDELTISQLLKMRSGLYNYTSAPEIAETLDNDPTRAWTPGELLAVAFKRPPVSAPGTEYEYCNTNYVMLGLIAEKLDGKPLAGIFMDRLFGPLGMKATLLPANISNAIPEPYAHGYLYGSTSFALADAPYPADVVAAAEAGTLEPNDDTHQNPSYAFAAGGAISTPDDLATWIKALVTGKVLDAEYQRRWLESPDPQNPDAPEGQKYGYGISMLSFGPNRLYFHGGEMPGYNSFIGYDPVNDVTLILWTSLTVSVQGKSPANTLMLKILEQIYSVSPLQKKG